MSILFPQFMVTLSLIGRTKTYSGLVCAVKKYLLEMEPREVTKPTPPLPVNHDGLLPCLPLSLNLANNRKRTDTQSSGWRTPFFLISTGRDAPPPEAFHCVRGCELAFGQDGHVGFPCIAHAGFHLLIEAAGTPNQAIDGPPLHPADNFQQRNSIVYVASRLSVDSRSQDIGMLPSPCSTRPSPAAKPEPLQHSKLHRRTKSFVSTI